MRCGWRKIALNFRMGRVRLGVLDFKLEAQAESNCSNVRLLMILY
jgi:hypothetical protein